MHLNRSLLVVCITLGVIAVSATDHEGKEMVSRVYKGGDFPKKVFIFRNSPGRWKREERRWRGSFGINQRQQGKSTRWSEYQDLDGPERVQVVSSALRVLPRRNRRKRSEEVLKPKRHQFVTNSRVGKYLEPEPFRYRPSAERRLLRPRNAPRRIVYYATLPEIVRHPLDWSPPPQRMDPPHYPGYPSLQDNEIVRVQSPVIDVTMNKDKYVSRSPSKIRIVDAPPPYYRRPYYPYEPYEAYTPIYRYHEDRRVPPRVHHYMVVPPPPNSVTVVKKPLDVRPLDPINLDLSTTSTPTPPPSTTSSTTLNPVATFERSFKY